MALNQLGLGFVFSARDLASGKIAGLARSMSGLDAATLRAQQGFARNMGAMAASVGVFAAGAVGLFGAFALAGTAGEFEQKLARVGAISRATAGQMKLLHDAAIQAGIATSFSPVEAVEGLENLAAQGFNTAQSIKLLMPALQLAEGGQIAVASATAATTSAVKVFGLSMEEATTVADKLLKISNMTSLQARDMELALGTVARGASLTGQSLEEMLVAMGLVRNTGVDTSVAAQSVSSALIFMAGRSKKFNELGVSVTDASGKFRNFVDVVQETSVALEKRYTDQAERAAEATKLFSRFGLQAYSAVTQQLKTGVTDLAGRVYRGADAVTFLRREMEETAGTAQKFQEQLLNTFQGQKTLLQGSLQTLSVVLGEGFARALKPLVGLVIAGVNRIIAFVNSLPLEFRTFLSQVALAVGAVLTVVGGALSAATAFAVILPFLKAGLVALGGVLTSLLPFVAVLAAVGAVFYALKVAVDKNLGGIGDAWRRFSGAVALAFRGLVQLFSEGGFSGAVMEEMRKAENSGIRRFAVGVFQVGHRVAQFFRGVWIGFSTALEASGFTFQRLSDAILRLGRALGFVGEEGVGALAGIHSFDFAVWGTRLGNALGFVVDVFARVWTAAATYLSGLVEGFDAAFSTLSPVFSALGDALGVLAEQFVGLLHELGIGVAEGAGFTDVFLFLGRVVGGVVATGVGVLAGALTGVTYIISGALWVVRQLGETFREVGQLIGRVAGAIGDWISGMVDEAIADFGSLVGAIPSFLRPESAEVVVEAGRRAEARMAAAGDRRIIPSVLGALSSPVGVAQVAGAAEEMRAQRERASAESVARAEELVLKQMEAFANRATVVNLTVDGQKLATAVAKSKREVDRASFTGPVESET